MVSTEVQTGSREVQMFTISCERGLTVCKRSSQFLVREV